METTLIDLAELYYVRKGEFAIVDVPELGYVMVEGEGPPDSGGFAEALRALFAVSYGAHFMVKKERSQARKVMPLEVLWWVTDPQQETFQPAAFNPAVTTGADRAAWRWRAMMMQPDPIDAGVIARAIEVARAKDLPALDELRYESWAEGRCCQVLHLGPYDQEPVSIAWLMRSVAAAGYRVCGRHHEIYLSDPRRTPPERLRTILRYPIEPLPD